MVIWFCCFFLQGPYVRNSNAELEGRMYARRGSDDDGHHGDYHRQDHDRHGRGRDHRDYKYHRYYPEYYYYKKRIYYPVYKKYYFYYDVFPERIYYYEGEKERRSYNPNYVPISSIAHMGAQGVPDEVIIEEIRKTNSAYALDINTIEYLRQNNVADSVIDYMLGTDNKEKGN